jgi:XTP/dITP diphosphohydrolase
MAAMQLVLASNNAGKLAELQQLFAELSVTLVPQSALGVGEAEEPFRTL